jgi:hypothetical protein
VVELRGCLDELAPLERRTIVMRAGLGPPPPRSRAAVRRRLELSRREVRRFERRALRGLRKAQRAGECVRLPADAGIDGGLAATGGGDGALLAAAAGFGAAAVGAVAGSDIAGGGTGGDDGGKGGNGGADGGGGDSGGVRGESEDRSPARSFPSAVLPGEQGGGWGLLLALAGVLLGLFAFARTRRYLNARRLHRAYRDY